MSSAYRSRCWKGCSRLTSATVSLTVLLDHVPESASTTGDRVTSVSVRDLRTGHKRTITAQYFLDATELGDLLPMTKAEYVTGAESQAQTGEMHASSVPQPANSQSFTFCFAMDLMEGEDHTIDKPQRLYVLARLRPQADSRLDRPLAELDSLRTENAGSA